MESSTTSFKDNEKPTTPYPTRATVYPPEVYPPPPHYGGGYPQAGHSPPPPMPGYGGHPSAPPQYNIGPYYPPQAYGYPHHPTGYGYAPTPVYPPAENIPTKKKKKSGIGKIMLGLGAGLVGGILLGDLASESVAAAPSCDTLTDPSDSFVEMCDASSQFYAENSDLMNSI